MSHVAHDPRHTELPGVGHVCWHKVYGNDELDSWMLKQKKKSP